MYLRNLWWAARWEWYVWRKFAGTSAAFLYTEVSVCSADGLSFDRMRVGDRIDWMMVDGVVTLASAFDKCEFEFDRGKRMISLLANDVRLCFAWTNFDVRWLIWNCYVYLSTRNPRYLLLILRLCHLHVVDLLSITKRPIAFELSQCSHSLSVHAKSYIAIS